MFQDDDNDDDDDDVLFSTSTGSNVPAKSTSFPVLSY
jgi:hypothetical protein